MQIAAVDLAAVIYSWRERLPGPNRPVKLDHHMRETCVDILCTAASRYTVYNVDMNPSGVKLYLFLWPGFGLCSGNWTRIYFIIRRYSKKF